jgi:D-amino-acid oxidase
MSKRIALIGGGISGLSTAFTLLQAGFDVTVVAADFSSNIVSFKAAAYWFPHHLQNDKRGIQWSLTSYHVFKTLSANNATGISMATIKKVAKQEADNDTSWMAFMPKDSYQTIDATALPNGYAVGHEAIVPLIETQIFLPWLLTQIKQLGATLIQETVQEFSILSQQYDFVINCTAMGAATLCNDKQLIPVRGQIVLVEPGYPNYIFLDKAGSTYIVPRKDGTIIGGTYEENIGEAKTDEQALQHLHEKAVAALPNLSQQKIIGSWAGIRPYRPTVRVEKEGNIIHNYGHGGSGYTLSFGCAENVLALVQEK